MYQKFEKGDRVKWIVNGEEIIGVVLDRIDFEDGTYEYSFRIDRPHPESLEGEPIKIDTEEDQIMTREELYNTEKQLSAEYEKKINDLRARYIAEHAEFKVGDVITYKRKEGYQYHDDKRHIATILEVTAGSTGAITYIIEGYEKDVYREAVNSDYYDIKKIQEEIW